MATIETELPQTVERPAEVDEVGQVLLRAADLMRTRGFGQYGYQKTGYDPTLVSIDGPSSLCAVNAISAAAEGYGTPAHTRFYRSMGFGEFGSPNAIWWNDTPGRTKEEVIEALERAAYGV